MTKYSFTFKCIEEIFTPMVVANFAVENYNSFFRFFYKELFDNYVNLSRQYDRYYENKSLSSQEKEAILSMMVNGVGIKNYNNFISSLDDIIKSKGLTYDVVDRYEKLSSTHKVSDVINQILKEIRAEEERLNV